MDSLSELWERALPDKHKGPSPLLKVWASPPDVGEGTPPNGSEPVSEGAARARGPIPPGREGTYLCLRGSEAR